MTDRVNRQRLQAAANLQRFIDEEVLPGSGIGTRVRSVF
jgi:malate synthase